MKKITLLTALFLLFSFGINAQITSYPYFEDFESGDGGWVVDNPGNVSWELGTPANTDITSADSGVNAWVTNLTGNYADNENGSVVSPIFDFSSLTSPAIEFSIWWNSEFSWDGMVLQSSIDDGTTWVNVGNLGDPNNWFNDGTIGGNPGGQQIGWTGRDGTGSGGWVIARRALDGLAGQASVLFRFAFGSDGSVNDDGIAFDTINIFDVTCPEPTNFALDTFSDVEAQVSWTAGGSEGSWEVVIQPGGTGVPTGAGVATTNNPYTITGLTASTVYEVWVRSDCGSGEFSSWTGPLNFTTLNTPPPPPVGVTCTSGGSSFIFVAEFDAVEGWTGTLNGGDGTWEIPDDSGSGGTGPDAAFSGASFMNYEASGGTTDRASAVTPAIDLSTAVDGAELSFYMHAFGADMGTLEVGVGTSATGPFTNEFIWIGDLQTSETDPWVPIGINLDAYLGQVIYVEFAHTGTGDFEGDMSIDLVRVESCGTFCIPPSNIVASNITADSVDINWTSNGTETVWEYVVVPAGSGEPTGSGTSVNTLPATATGLIPVTDYEIWVRSDCGGGSFSTWSGPVNFLTGCSVFIPEYLETFDNIIPNCWDEADNGDPGAGPADLGGSSWVEDGYLNDGFTGAYKINLWLAEKNDWLLSPQFDLTGGPFQVDFDFGIMTFGSTTTAGTLGSDDQVQLLISNDNGATWVNLVTFDNTSVVPATGTQVVANLAAYSGQIVQFGIWATEGATDDPQDNDVFVDNFRVRLVPTCPEPTGLTLDTFSDVEATVSWTPGAAESAWEVAIQPAGTGLPTGPGVSTTDNPYTITGLTAITDYEVWVRAECGPGDLSSWVGPLNFTTLNTPPPPPAGVSCSSGSSSFIFTADFDGVEGWTGTLNGGDGTWEIPDDSGSGGTGPDAAFNGDNFMNYEASGGTTATASAVTPAIDLTPALDGAELSFYMHAFGADMGTLNVGVGNSPTGPFTNEFTWTGDLQTSETDPWVPVGVNLDAYLGQVIYVEFSHTGTGDFEGDMSIDFVRVETCGSFCIAPSSITATNVTQTTADISWTANSGESVWEYVVVPAGTGEPTGPGNSVTTTSVMETGLTGTTEYEIWVRADCGGGVFSLWAGPIPFFTAPENNDPCNAQMAVVNPDETCDQVTFGTIFQATASGVPTGSCAGDPDDDVWFEFVAEDTTQVISIINIQGGTFNIDHAVYEGPCDNLTELFCSDDEFSFDQTSYVIGNTYYIRIFSGGSIPETSTFDLCIRSAPSNTICEEADNPCISQGTDVFIFPSVIGLEPGPEPNDIACLGSAPNPSWFEFEVGASGVIEFEIAQFENFDDMGNPVGDDLDVDFVLWGPFDSTTDYCNLTPDLETDCPCPNNTADPNFYPFGNVVDCSFSIQGIENFTIDNAVAGEIYVLLVANWSRDPGFIRISQTNSGGGFFTAEIDADLGPDIEFCGVDSIDLVANSPFADRFEWYEDGFLIPGEDGPTLTVTESNTYQVIAFDDGCVSQALDEIVVTLGLSPVANTVDDIVTCDDESGDGIEEFDLEIQTAAVLGGQDPALFEVTYHTSQSDAGQDLSPIDTSVPFVSGSTTIWIRVDDPTAAICFDLIEFDLVVGGAIPTANSDTYELCDDNGDGLADFDLPSRDANILGGQSPLDFTVSYYLTDADAQAGTSPIDTSSPFTSGTTTIFVRVESNLTFDCFDTNTVDLVVNDTPDSLFILDDLVTCDDPSGDNVEDFDLEVQTPIVIGSQDASTINVTYHLSLADAEAGSFALSSPYSNISNPQTIFVRVENSGATECFITSSFDLIISGPIPTANPNVVYAECDDDFDGFTDFDLTTQDANILDGQSPSDFTVTYHETQADADSGTGAITGNSYNSDSRTLFVRVENNNAFDCFVTTTMELLVDPLPNTTFTTDFDYEVCPNATVPIQIEATANNYDEASVSISWTVDGASIPGESSLTLPVLTSGTYEITVVNSFGCESSASVDVIELESCVIPQGISPNGDGRNDVFDLSSYNVSKLEIFNRLGTRVYYKENYTNEWDGRSDDGDELPTGTYFYTMEYDNGKERSAWVYIQREN